MKPTHPWALFFLLPILMGQSVLPQDLRFYDPTAFPPDDVPIPSGVVSLSPGDDRGGIKIPQYFYGVNETILPAPFAFRNMTLIKALKPDVIRIFTQKQTQWSKIDNVVKREDFPLSPKPGRFHWEQLDAHVKAILDTGAMPYISLGFGSPSWLGENSADRFPRPSRGRLGEYAAYMASVIQHLVIDKKFPVKWVSIDNEPENVKYPIDDYLELFQLASAAIKKIDPTILIAGPATGYAAWIQPDKTALSFGSSSKYLVDHGFAPEVVDWHVYSTATTTILRTADTINRTYGNKPFKVLSELNRDWRYSPKDQAAAISNNTGWGSVAWLLTSYDHLQRSGVNQVHYFDLISTPFGLLDYWLTQVRPNYFTFWACTTVLGRDRVPFESSHPSIGAIATRENGRLTALIYNRVSAEVTLEIKNTEKFTQQLTFDFTWYQSNSEIRNGQINFPKWTEPRLPYNIPPGGFLILR